MNISNGRRLLAAVALLSGFALPTTALAVELLVNGGFESGDFSGWSVFNLANGQGDWGVVPGMSTPLSSHGTVGPASGNWYAVSDQNGQGSHVLEQVFSVPIDARSVRVSFRLFVNDWSGLGPVVGPGLAFDGDVNQHARVDVLAIGDPFDVGGAVMANAYLGIDSGEPPHGWTDYALDISGLVVQGGVYRLRFAEVDNQGFLNMGVDDVSVTAAVPEPSSWALMAAGCVWLARRVHRGRVRPGIVPV